MTTMTTIAVAMATRVSGIDGTSKRRVRAIGTRSHSQRPLRAMNGSSSRAYQEYRGLRMSSALPIMTSWPSQGWSGSVFQITSTAMTKSSTPATMTAEPPGATSESRAKRVPSSYPSSER